MDLGLRGRKAIVCASSKGLGRACAIALAREGVDVVVNGRTPETVRATAAEIRAAYPVRVSEAVGDVATEAGRAALLAACPDADILINNPCGRPLAGDFRTWDGAVWTQVFREHMLAQLLLINGVIDGMIARRFGRIVNITASFVKFPQVRFAHTHGLRLGLTGAVAAIAREVSRHNITINGILPGVFDTDALNTNMRRLAQETGRTYDEVRAERIAANPARRIADTMEAGDLCAYLCGANAGFVTGQNIVIDGGVYPGVF